MVRGEKDKIYRKFANHYNRIIGKPPKYTEDPLEEIYSALWVIECEGAGDELRQGTGFMLEDFGIVTCQHVLLEKICVFQYHDLKKKYVATIVAENTNLDVAILKIGIEKPASLKRGDETGLKHRDLLTVAGFPNYNIGDTPSIIDARIRSFRMRSTLKWVLLNAPIISGNSGGPVLNSDNHVMGIAATGGDSIETAHLTEHNGVIPISALDHLEI